MRKRKADMPKSDTSSPAIQPVSSPTAKEQQMIALSMDQAEKQLREGTASSQIVVHFLKLATEKERLEKEKLRRENLVLEAKAKAYETSGDIQRLYSEAIAAMKKYSGANDETYQGH